MNKLTTYIKHLEKEGFNPTWNQNKGILKLKLMNGRLQTITIVKDNELYVLHSIVAKMDDIKKRGFKKQDFLLEIWATNRNEDIINFTIDEKDNIIGRLELYENYIDADEFVYSVKQLSMECDKYEFALTGKDEY